MKQLKTMLALGLALSLFGARVLADDMMACCKDKKECCKDKKPCCSMKEGQWGGDEKGEKKEWKGDWKGGEGHEGQGPMGRMAEKLGLSEDQKTKLKALHEKQAESWKALGEEMRASIKALKAGVDGGAKDSELVKLMGAVEASKAKMRAQEDKSVQDMKKILTVPQQAKAALFFAHKAKEMREGGREGMRNGGMKGKRRADRDDEGEDEDEGGHEHGEQEGGMKK